MSIARLAASLRNLLVRGKVTSAAVGPRTLLQITGFDNDTFGNVELLLPPGYVALPAAGADVLLMNVSAVRDHKVAVGGDTVGQTISSLAAGEFGLRGTGIQLVMRSTGQIQLQADGETLRQLVTDQFTALFNAHTHPTPSGTSSPPNQMMTSAQLTGALHAGGQS